MYVFIQQMDIDIICAALLIGAVECSDYISAEV